MISISDGLNSFYLPDLNVVGYNLQMGLNDWLKSGREYFPSGNQPNNQFSIGTYEYKNFTYPYAFDINRLSCAALESIHNVSIGHPSPKFLGWTIVKYYYSAFFSVHCILKICNESLTNIDKNSLDKVRQITRNYSYSYGNLNKGLYCLSVDHSKNSFTFYKDSQYDDSHEGTWLKFLHFLKNSILTIEKNLPRTDALTIISKLYELIEALTNWESKQGNWLSRIRNSANYSQSFGIWYPYKIYKSELDNIASDQFLCMNNPLTIDIQPHKNNDLIYFVKTCQLINSICFDLLLDIRSRNPENNSFISQGIVKYYRTFIKKSNSNCKFFKNI